MNKINAQMSRPAYLGLSILDNFRFINDGENANAKYGNRQVHSPCKI